MNTNFRAHAKAYRAYERDFKAIQKGNSIFSSHHCQMCLFCNFGSFAKISEQPCTIYKQQVRSGFPLMSTGQSLRILKTQNMLRLQTMR